jgi:hypothetical protein
MIANRAVAGIATLLTLGLVPALPNTAIAHCDGMDGPVVEAARKALARGDVNLVLIWVQKGDEKEIREAFDRARKVRELGTEARQLADRFFFETVVRVHRAGEGAPYTGLKPAGRDLGPAIPLADRILTTGNVDALENLLAEEIRRGVVERFERAAKTRDFPTADVDAGRDYVRAYVTFIHYVERAYEAGNAPVAGHFPDAPRVPTKHDM